MDSYQLGSPHKSSSSSSETTASSKSSSNASKTSSSKSSSESASFSPSPSFIISLADSLLPPPDVPAPPPLTFEKEYPLDFSLSFTPPPSMTHSSISLTDILLSFPRRNPNDLPVSFSLRQFLAVSLDDDEESVFASLPSVDDESDDNTNRNEKNHKGMSCNSISLLVENLLHPRCLLRWARRIQQFPPHSRPSLFVLQPPEPVMLSAVHSTPAVVNEV
ncbi:uncharacterized protein MONOS_7348 [Monocercomonoides exilis]|uniref:uncharacterized protein n=1 Tax=Monocercomonoides exilis TaxID=2049356 RepID=UPI00355AB6A2|nr:hypothetical protein MONOS_7348 [Monocercomonoides exilis]|eukprot:MONOS_7348.1-p1 / transcript=MONOS_7348.1 / gene=MONOS_7348 / organism=Monocercomonoides_exilis_PA203 / gene_product=unspecified product / transcript_product=unspecified product / location=Mono_scaffold00249:29463-30119(-) / protein_length=219 / sequence_SO=supercontig / SO=protein_coding / is_pseudo=false